MTLEVHEVCSTHSQLDGEVNLDPVEPVRTTAVKHMPLVANISIDCVVLKALGMEWTNTRGSCPSRSIAQVWVC